MFHFALVVVLEFCLDALVLDVLFFARQSVLDKGHVACVKDHFLNLLLGEQSRVSRRWVVGCYLVIEHEVVQHLIENRSFLPRLRIHFQLMFPVSKLADFRVNLFHLWAEKRFEYLYGFMWLDFLFLHKARVESLHRSEQVPRWRSQRHLHNFLKVAFRDVVDHSDVACFELLV